LCGGGKKWFVAKALLCWHWRNPVEVGCFCYVYVKNWEETVAHTNRVHSSRTWTKNWLRLHWVRVCFYLFLHLTDSFAAPLPLSLSLSLCYTLCPGFRGSLSCTAEYCHTLSVWYCTLRLMVPCATTPSSWCVMASTRFLLFTRSLTLRINSLISDCRFVLLLLCVSVSVCAIISSRVCELQKRTAISEHTQRETDRIHSVVSIWEVCGMVPVTHLRPICTHRTSPPPPLSPSFAESIWTMAEHSLDN